MAESNPNQQAFMKVSEELRRLENSLAVLDTIRPLLSQQSYTIQKIKDVKMERIYTDEVEGLLPFVKLFSGGVEGLNTIKEKMTSRIEELRALSDAYLRGEDVLQTKLGRTR